MADDLEPTVFILFGATGDLAKRMVLPAFYQLYLRGLLPQRWKLVGNGRGDVAHEDFRAHFHDSLTEFAEEPAPEQWDAFAADLLFAGGGFRSHDPGSLLEVIDEAKSDLGSDPKIIHYLAIPPSTFAPTTEAINTHDLSDGATAVYEKPYGTSPDSLAELDASSATPSRKIRSSGSTISRKEPPRTCTSCGSQSAVRRDLELRLRRRGADRRAGDPRYRRPRSFYDETARRSTCW